MIFKNFYFYAIVFPLITLTNNLLLAFVSKKKYPQYFCDGDISDGVKDDIKHRIRALIYNKVGVAIINGSGNLVISKFLGLVVLGIYVSYYYIFSILHQFVGVIYDSLTPGIGNKMVVDSVENNYIRFKRFYFLNCWVITICSVCLLCLYESFIELWIGGDKAQGVGFAVLMAVFFYFWMIRFAVIVYKNALGLWWEDRFRPFVEGIVNLLLSLILVHCWGLYGVVISAVIAMMTVSIPWETSVLFKHYFKIPLYGYYRTLFVSLLIAIVVSVLTYFVVNQIIGGGVARFVLKTIMTLLVANILMALLYSQSDDFKYYIGRIKHFNL